MSGLPATSGEKRAWVGPHESWHSSYAKDFASASHSRRRNLYGAIMEAMRQSWTDDRLDDLNGKVDALRLEMRAEFRAIRGEAKSEFGGMKEEFGAIRGGMKEEFAAVRGEMKGEFGAVRGEMKEEFAAIRGEMKAEFRAVRGEMKAGFDKIDERFDALQRTLLQISGGVIATLIAGFAGVVATQL
jgi:hypothetical protein